MEIVVHKSFTLKSPDDVYDQYSAPIWEIEIVDPELNSAEFLQSMTTESNFETSAWHNNLMRKKFSGTMPACLANRATNQLLDIVLEHQLVCNRFPMGKKWYQDRCVWSPSIFLDLPGFSMTPHIDNAHVMVHVIVNLVQDNDNATDFYYFDQDDPVYRAPTKKHHGVMFVNTPGAMHALNAVLNPRCIWYAQILI